MKMISGFQTISAPPQEGTALTIGNFDGLHLGHRALVGEVLSAAMRNSWTSALVTFDPHPLQFLQPELGLKRLFPVSDLQAQAKDMGLDYLVVEEFSQVLATMDPEEFWAERVVPALNPRLLVVGHDFNFGAGPKGNLDFLKALASREGFELRVVPPIRLAGDIVSSSRIRGLVSQGKVEEAHPLLGRPFAVRGQVSQGDQKGRQLGFPTANLEGIETLLPAKGVYFTQTQVPGGGLIPSVTNLGCAPTLRGADSGLRLESHLLEEGNWKLYNKEIEVRFLAHLRPERKFSGIDELKTQIKKDVKEAQNFWKNREKASGQRLP